MKANILLIEDDDALAMGLEFLFKQEGMNVTPEIMIPLVGDVNELKYVKSVVTKTADEIIAAAGGNIVRVNYNKAVDLHTLFIEVSAAPAQHDEIARKLSACG